MALLNFADVRSTPWHAGDELSYDGLSLEEDGKTLSKGHLPFDELSRSMLRDAASARFWK